MQQDVQGLFADVESVRDSLETVNTMLESEQEPPAIVGSDSN